MAGWSVVFKMCFQASRWQTSPPPLTTRLLAGTPGPTLPCSAQSAASSKEQLRFRRFWSRSTRDCPKLGEPALHHAGVVVKQLEGTMDSFQQESGLPAESPASLFSDAMQQLRVALFPGPQPNPADLGLIEPAGPASPGARFAE